MFTRVGSYPLDQFPISLFCIWAIPPGKSILSGYLVILSMLGISYFTDMIAFTRQV